MAFGNLDTHGLPMLLGYSDALVYFNRIKPWRGSSDTIRPVHPSRRRHMEMRLTNDNSVAFRLYNTDVVTWHPDNSFTVKPYPSPTTDKFASALLPGRICARFNSQLGTILQVNDQLYLCRSATRVKRIDDTWTVVDGTEPIVWPVLNKAKARAALRDSRYNDFMLWRKATVAMGAKVDPDWFWDGANIYDMLQDQGQWMALHRKMHSSRHEKLVRNMVYQRHGALSVTSAPSIHWTHADRVARVRRQYRFAY